MLAFARGDAAAFDVLYQRHRGWLYNTITRQLGSPSQADDVFQETWFSLVRASARYEPSAKFTTWLYLLARQRMVDHWRVVNPEAGFLSFNGNDHEDQDTADIHGSSGTPPELRAALRDDAANPQQLAESAQIRERLDTALRALPPLQKEALLLFEYADMSLDEIARTTGSSRETVKSRLRYARNRLAELLRGSGI